MGNLTQKGKGLPFERDNNTDRLQNFVHIYTLVFTGTYTGHFCHNPVESGRMDAFLQESGASKSTATDQDIFVHF